jgi:hypothetical protein
MAYRSPASGIAMLEEEQRELQALERQARARKVRVGVTLAAALGAIVAGMLMIASQPAPAHLECRESRREHEVFIYPGGRIQRPADTWTTCAWR